MATPETPTVKKNIDKNGNGKKAKMPKAVKGRFQSMAAARIRKLREEHPSKFRLDKGNIKVGDFVQKEFNAGRSEGKPVRVWCKVTYLQHVRLWATPLKQISGLSRVKKGEEIIIKEWEIVAHRSASQGVPVKNNNGGKAKADNSMKIGSIKPEVIALRKLFKEEASSLRIPSIQRQFVWDPEDIKELIDSIVSGYPIGAVIIWEPSASFPSAPLIGEDTDSDGERYVLDGQQRLTALMLIKNGWQLARGSKKILTTAISYIPENEKLYLSSKKGIDLSLIVNATLGDADCLMRLQKEYPALYKKAIDQVGERIVNYELPFYILKTGVAAGEEVYEKIAEIFTRVNSAGVKIGNLEMFLSFFAAAFPKEEKEKIIAMHEEFSEKYELDLEPIVRFVFSRMGLTQNQVTKVAAFKKSIRALREKYSEEKAKIGKSLDRCGRSIQIVMQLLHDEFGISTTQYVPSQNALLPLFDAVYERGYQDVRETPPKERTKMLRWFLIASFNGIYSSSPNYKLDEDLDLVRKNSKGFPLRELLASMQGRSPHRSIIENSDITKAYNNVLRGRVGKEYLMILDVLLHRNEATDWAGRALVSEDAAVHHIFPREFLKENGETRDEMINCLANLTFISPEINSEIGDTPPEEYLPLYDEQILERHVVPLNKRLWKVDNFQDFLDARLQLIWKKTDQLLEELD